MDEVVALDYPALLAARLLRPPLGWLDVTTSLRHFAIISYLVPLERLRPHVNPQFGIVPFTVDGRKYGLLSVVPFLDQDFCFSRLPWLRFRFGQTNYRLYVTDQQGEDQAWFFGTTLGAAAVAFAHHAWQLPWYRARYQFATTYSASQQRYTRYQVRTQSAWAAAEIALVGTGHAMGLLPGFHSLDQQRYVLTNPVRGVFYRRDGRLGSYTIWHPAMELTTGRLLHARFALLERLGILSRQETQQPHSVLLSPRVEFQISLPPALYKEKN